MHHEPTTPNQRPAGFYARATLEILGNGTNRPSVYLRQYRIAGPKPWGGGSTTETYSVRKLSILAATAETALDETAPSLELSIWKSKTGKACVMLDNQALFGRANQTKTMDLEICFPVSIRDLRRALE